MSHILIAWELGNNYGHLARLLPIALCLKQRGHRVTFAVRDTRTAAELLAPAGFLFLQAPLARRKPRLANSQASYAEILLGVGYADALGLSGMVRAWLAILRLGMVDAVLADHAPTALLATHLVGIPHLAIGNGFAIPPDITPLPSIRPWDAVPEARLRHANQSIDAAISAVAVKLGYQGALGLRDLFGMDHLLDTFAELDHYGERESGNYIGPILGLADVSQVAWQAEHGKKILVYLRPDVPGFQALMTTLGEVDAEKLCIVPGLRPEQARRLANRRMRIAVRPVALGRLLDRADIVVSYGGSGMTAAALLAGVPLLLAPRYVEQYLGAARVEVLGAGILLGNDRNKVTIAKGLDTLLGNPGHTDHARRFADKYAGFTSHFAVTRAIDTIEAYAERKRSGFLLALNG